MIALLKGQKEAKFKDAFFRGQTFNEGIEMAGKALCISRAEVLDFFMTYQPTNPHDITSSYIFACRYKRQNEAGMTYTEIAKSIGYNRTVVSSAVKVAEVFGPADIQTDLVISDYKKVAFSDQPKEELLKIRNLKRTKAAKVGGNSREVIGRFTGKKSNKDIFISQSKMAYEMRMEGSSMPEIAKVFSVSLGQASVMSRAGALPDEILQSITAIKEVRQAIQTPNPAEYLKKISSKRENVFKETTAAEEPLEKYSEGFSAEQLKAFAFGILNMLAENSQLKNKYEKQVDINIGLEKNLQAEKNKNIELSKEMKQLYAEVFKLRKFKEIIDTHQSQLRDELKQVM